MLSIMRRHAGWGLKLVLGIITVSFVFYFGYTQIAGQQTRESTAIQVGKQPITVAWYNFFYNEEQERMKQQFKGEGVPDFYQKIIENQARQRVVYRNLMKQFAASLGLAVTDLELAESITQSKNFDPVEYKNFLQYFYNNNAFSYENLVREELLVAKFQEWVRKQAVQPPPSAPRPMKNQSWTFETQIVGQNKTAEKVGPLSLGERHRLFPGVKLGMEDHLRIFSLSKEKPEHQFEKQGVVYRVRLVEKMGPAEKETGDFEPNLVDIWFRKFADGINIRSYIPQEAP